jgi:hypothetical protein
MGQYPARDQFPGEDTLVVWTTLPSGLHALWTEHRAEILGDWIRVRPGTRPYAWWRFEAPEPRQVVVGAELLKPTRAPDDWAFVWRGNFGRPAFVQVRPRGWLGLPAIESHAAYLDRLGLLTPGERDRLEPDDFEPEEHDPFLLDAEELDRLLAAGGNAAHRARALLNPRSIRA